jgi:hypothetical protein
LKITLHTKADQVRAVLYNQNPERIVYAPNYWQWFTHRINHNQVPKELQHCNTQLDVINYLNLDVFSRNVYSNPYEYWFGGLSEEIYEKAEKKEKAYKDGKDTIIEKKYRLPSGELSEKLRYVFKDSTLVQEKQLIENYKEQLTLFTEFIQDRSWQFDKDKFIDIKTKVGDAGVLIAGELFSPLKMLHLCLGLIDTTYFLIDHEDLALELLHHHEKKQLELLKQMLEADVEVVMAMDNLDASFHPPYYLEKYSASFYEKASSLCHRYKSKFFIHACGKQKTNLRLISALGVDGLEGVAYPPLGDIELDEAFQMSHDTFIITGGISAHEIENLRTRQQVFDYVQRLFERIKPFSNRFMFSASCNTPINTSWETIKHFRDAWLEYGEL